MTELAIQRSVRLRLRRQVHELALALPAGELTDEAIEQVGGAFTAEYERQFGEGTAYTVAGVELVGLRVEASFPLGVQLPDRPHATQTEPVGEREAIFAGKTRPLPGLRRHHDRRRDAGVRSRGDRGPDHHDGRLPGPDGDRRHDRQHGSEAVVSAARQDAILFEVLRHRLWAINDEAATTIARVSGSPVANESYDFNTALMDGDGNVVVIGAYVMAHACALDRVVRYVIDEHSDNPGFGPGDMYVTNDPYVGAMHQPDVVVVAPIFVEGELTMWCGSVVHQPDVGGPLAGSVTDRRPLDLSGGDPADAGPDGRGRTDPQGPRA